MAEETESQRLRSRGTAYYKQAVALSPEDANRVKLLEMARKLYGRALEAGTELEDIASAHKNIAAAVSAQIYSSETEDVLALYCESLDHRCQCLVLGSDGNKSEEWLDTVESSIHDCMHNMLDAAFEQLTADLKQICPVLRILHKALSVIPDTEPGIKLQFTCEMVESMCEVAEDAICPGSAESDWRSCLYVLAEMKRPLLEGLQLAVESEAQEEVQSLLELEDKMFAIQCRCESAQVLGISHIKSFLRLCLSATSLT
jgi:hypothetical protein